MTSYKILHLQEKSVKMAAVFLKEERLCYKMVFYTS